MKKIAVSMGICVLMSLSALADLIVYEGFGYGNLTDFQHDVANPNAAGGVGFAADGWKQYNSAADGLVSVVGSASITTPTGYEAIKTVGFMTVNRGANTSATMALRTLASGISASADTEYWFSVVIRNNDNSSSISDASRLIFREGGTTRMFAGFDNNENLQIQLAGTAVTGTDPTVFAKGNNVTILGKLVLSSTGVDSLYVSAFQGGSTITGEPLSWDLSVSGELGTAVIDSLGLSVGAGNSRVDFDEIRIGTEFADVIPEPATIGMVVLGSLFTLILRRKLR